MRPGRRRIPFRNSRPIPLPARQHEAARLEVAYGSVDIRRRHIEIQSLQIVRGWRRFASPHRVLRHIEIQSLQIVREHPVKRIEQEVDQARVRE
jgi:hypothetical protein